MTLSIRNFFKQPIVHFMAIGIGVFILYGAVRSEEKSEVSNRTIIVDRQAMIDFLQYSNKSLETGNFELYVDKMSNNERQQWINDLVREEVLFREAKLLQLDRGDNVIKRRLIQKMNYIGRGFYETTQTVSEDEVQKYYEAHKQNYTIESVVTFTHIFFNSEMHGAAKAQILATDMLARLKADKIQHLDIITFGDHFRYHVNYVERSIEFVKSHFGEEMGEVIFNLEQGEDVWAGPYKSPYGYHLVKLSNKSQREVLPLKEVEQKIRHRIKRSNTARDMNAVVQKIVDTYAVKVTF